MENKIEAKRTARSKLLCQHKDVENAYHRELSDNGFTAEAIKASIEQSREIPRDNISFGIYMSYRKVQKSTKDIKSTENDLKRLKQTRHDLELKMSKTNAKQQEKAEKVTT